MTPWPPAWGPCPWGEVLSATAVMPGVTYLRTARHGGYHLSPECNRQLPDSARRDDGYYEQDFQGALPAYFLLFPGADRTSALVVIETQFPEVYAQIVRGEVT